MESRESLRRTYDRCVAEGTRLAGGLQDLSQRATVYHHLFVASGRNHAFPLIAAHGALWAGGYFRFGIRLGLWLSVPAMLVPGGRDRRLESLRNFADAFRDINRRVCIDTYATFHFTAVHGEDPDASCFVAVDKLDALNRMHHARKRGVELTASGKLAAFETFFRSEQATVVGPSVQAAIESFAWPLMQFIALKPLIRFAYFPRGQWLRFRDFSSQDERIANGLRAFDLAAQIGFTAVEACLRNYAILPDVFFTANTDYFGTLRELAFAN
jgi:hypothetical protein